MDVYILQAALICADCCDEFKAENVKPTHVDEGDESSYDSDEWPKGPYGQGGGEADCAQHCDHCGVFLENALTLDGEQNVRDAWQEFVDDGRGNIDVLRTWAKFYDYVWSAFAEAHEQWDAETGFTDLQERRFADIAAGA